MRKDRFQKAMARGIVRFRVTYIWGFMLCSFAQGCRVSPTRIDARSTVGVREACDRACPDRGGDVECRRTALGLGAREPDSRRSEP